jgi:hypothetical protein
MRFVVVVTLPALVCPTPNVYLTRRMKFGISRWRRAPGVSVMSRTLICLKRQVKHEIEKVFHQTALPCICHN